MGMRIPWEIILPKNFDQFSAKLMIKSTEPIFRAYYKKKVQLNI